MQSQIYLLFNAMNLNSNMFFTVTACVWDMEYAIHITQSWVLWTSFISINFEELCGFKKKN